MKSSPKVTLVRRGSSFACACIITSDPSPHTHHPGQGHWTPFTAYGLFVTRLLCLPQRTPRACTNAHAVVTATCLGWHSSTLSCGISCGYKYHSLCSKADATLSKVCLQCQSPALRVSHRRRDWDAALKKPIRQCSVKHTRSHSLFHIKVFFGTDTATDARFFRTP